MDNELAITGECRYQIYKKEGDPCLACGVCTIDGNDYSAFDTRHKPIIN